MTYLSYVRRSDPYGPHREQGVSLSEWQKNTRRRFLNEAVENIESLIWAQDRNEENIYRCFEQIVEVLREMR